MVDRKLNKKFKGIAKCLPGDVFSEEKGRRIAQLKAESNREMYRIRRAWSALKHINKYADIFADELHNRVDIYRSNLEKKREELRELTV
jgi:hypothetical protein